LEFCLPACKLFRISVDLLRFSKMAKPRRIFVLSVPRLPWARASTLLPVPPHFSSVRVSTQYSANSSC
jgi:hypothetical protein